jgi:hypothetical protein
MTDYGVSLKPDLFHTSSLFYGASRGSASDAFDNIIFYITMPLLVIITGTHCLICLIIKIRDSWQAYLYRMVPEPFVQKMTAFNHFPALLYSSSFSLFLIQCRLPFCQLCFILLSKIQQLAVIQCICK